MLLSEGCDSVDARLPTLHSSDASVPPASRCCRTSPASHLPQSPTPPSPPGHGQASGNLNCMTSRGGSDTCRSGPDSPSVVHSADFRLRGRHLLHWGNEGTPASPAAVPRPPRLGVGDSALSAANSRGTAPPRHRPSATDPTPLPAPLPRSGHAAAAPPRRSPAPADDGEWRTNPRGFVTPRRDALLLRRYTRTAGSLGEALGKLRRRRLPLTSALAGAPAVPTGTDTTTHPPRHFPRHGGTAGSPPLRAASRASPASR